MDPATDAVFPKVEHAGDVAILTFTDGEPRDGGNVLARELDHLSAWRSPQHLLLDFRNVGYITGHELGTLVTLHQQLRDSGGRLTLFNLAPHVYEVFTITGLDGVLHIGR